MIRKHKELTLILHVGVCLCVCVRACVWVCTKVVSVQLCIHPGRPCACSCVPLWSLLLLIESGADTSWVRSYLAALVVVGRACKHGCCLCYDITRWDLFSLVPVYVWESNWQEDIQDSHWYLFTLFCWWKLALLFSLFPLFNKITVANVISL